MGRVREEKRREEERRSQRERVRRKKTQVREKVGKSRNTVFFPWFVAPEGRKVGSLKRRVRSHLATWEMKNCTPLWREAHLQVKRLKTFHVRNTFGSWAVEKSARRCGAKHISKSKCTKHTMFGPLFEVEMSKRCTPLWRKAHFEVKVQNLCIFRGRRSTRDMFIKAVRMSGRWFPERGSILEPQIFRFAEVIFPWQVQHFVWPGITFSWQARYFGQLEWKNRKTHWYEAVSSALNFPFLKDISQNCFVLMLSPSKMRTSRRIASFLTLSSSKIKDVSQNSCVFDVVKFKNWGESQNSFVFKLADRQTDRQIDKQTNR